MMHMMHADIRGEPAQNCGQVIMRTAMQSGIMQVPDRSLGPPCLLELMLNEKKPNANGSCEQRDRHMHKEKRPDTDQPHHRDDYERNDRVGGHRTDPGMPVGCRPERKAMLDNEKIGRT